MFMFTTFLILILLGFIFDKNEAFSSFIMALFLIFIIIILMLQVYCIKPESDANDLQSGKAKSIKKKRDLEKAFDAILNKNTSSTD
ncbi:ORF-60 [Buzura suppressaria nucleopolyhedrovirus]|uniref:ORF-60 n=1 Tax=Buzura suppressaria nuclear polyhedrosis virus TaxID=74320 RepID=W5VL46_NPVBS|nr:ORF-60 [Buzura suppressaria nucleopolyhedrovirus]AHH82649.1 ORF-60 [Buzura suppressaria nucleopolyhedrovirus]